MPFSYSKMHKYFGDLVKRIWILLIDVGTEIVPGIPNTVQTRFTEA